MAGMGLVPASVPTLCASCINKAVVGLTPHKKGLSQLKPQTEASSGTLLPKGTPDTQLLPPASFHFFASTTWGLHLQRPRGQGQEDWRHSSWDIFEAEAGVGNHLSSKLKITHPLSYWSPYFPGFASYSPILNWAAITKCIKVQTSFKTSKNDTIHCQDPYSRMTEWWLKNCRNIF